jgi:hypothetical protein
MRRKICTEIWAQIELKFPDWESRVIAWDHQLLHI